MIMTPHTSRHSSEPSPTHVEWLKAFRDPLQDSRPQAALSHFFMWLNHVKQEQPHEDWKVHVAIYVRHMQDHLVSVTLAELKRIESRILTNLSGLISATDTTFYQLYTFQDLSYHRWISDLVSAMEMELGLKKILQAGKKHPTQPPPGANSSSGLFPAKAQGASRKSWIILE